LFGSVRLVCNATRSGGQNEDRVSNGKPEPVDKLAKDVVAKDAAKQSGRPGKAQPTTVSRLPRTPGRWIGIGILALLLIVGGIGVYFTTRTGVSPGINGGRVSGGSGQHVDYYLSGRIISRSGCQGEFFRDAPKVGETHNLLEKMWLAGGVLHSTNDYGVSPPEYQGTLNKDGSFKLAWTQGDADGEKQAINGIINPDGQHISATWDSIFLVGCVLHLKSDEGHFLSGGSIVAFPDAPHR